MEDPDSDDLISEEEAEMACEEDWQRDSKGDGSVDPRRPDGHAKEEDDHADVLGELKHREDHVLYMRAHGIG